MRASSRWWIAWLAPLAVAGFTIGWCLFAYLAIGDRAPVWQYGTVPYVPGESVTSVEPMPKGAPPKQVELPPRHTGGSHAHR